MKHRIAILLFAIPLGILSVNGQTLRAYLTAAENALAEKDYFTAYTHLETVIRVDSGRIDVQNKLAEVARKYQAYNASEQLYRNVTQSKDADEYPNAVYWLAKMQHIQGKYDSALVNYKIFVSEQSDGDSTLLADANHQIKAAEWAKEHITELDDSTSVMRLGEQINTLFCEFGGVKRDSNLFFTRLGFERQQYDEKGRPKPPALLYSQVLESENFGMGELMDSTYNDPVKHTAHMAYNHDESRVYYTLCEYLNKSDIRCDLYYRDVQDTTFGEAHMLPAPINAEGYTTTQPNIGYDEVLEKDVLYFVSDRPGGKGGLDLWYAVIHDENNISQPEPLNDLNTTYDEASPFYHSESRTLYFSSQGWIGFGGFDIYLTQKVNNAWLEPENIGADINSSYDDVYYSLSPDEETALFSSNRIGSTYFESSREACCFDIYDVSANPVEVNLIVETYNKRTLAPLLYTDVTIVGANGVIETLNLNTEATHTVTTRIDRNKNYSVVGSKEGFDDDEAVFSTYGITHSIEITKKLYLDPSDIIVRVRTFDKRRREPLPGTTVEIVDDQGGFHGSKVNERSHVQYFGVPPINNYTITGARKGYLKAVAQLNEDQFDEDTVTVDLYLELGNLEDFLPLAIYFDNDAPDAKTTTSTTSLRYLQTYDPYYESKDKFKRRYARGASGNEEARLEGEIEAFFEGSLRKSKEEFESFLNILDQYLAEGLSFKIFLKGYTSPLASEQYNYQLAQRRITTIQNEFTAFRGGVLKKYFDSGDLEVTEKSFGEETAPANVSDDPRDTRLSIYSPEASTERRVEIIEIEKD